MKYEQEYNNKIWNQMNPLQALCETTIRPFLEPFIDIWVNLIPKMIFAIITGLIMLMSFLADLFQTPEIWWKGLMVLVFLDFLAGSTRAIFHPKLKFHWRFWTRTAYKFTSYACVVLALSAAANMMPEVFIYVRYAVICILVGSEVHSIIKKLPVPIVRTIEKTLKEKNIPLYGDGASRSGGESNEDKN